MSFWSTSDGEDVTKNATGEYDAGGGNFDPIPDDTNCLMMIESAAWAKDPNFNEYIQLTWLVVGPEAYQNRKVWQKLWVKDPEPNALKKGREDADKKRNNSLRMFANIDAIAGGKLGRAGREPDDDDLALALTNKQAICKLKVWEMGDKSGNWIAAVGPKGGNMEVSKGDATKPKREQSRVEDDEIPF